MCSSDLNVAQLVVKKMLKNKKRPGSVINMSSQLGHVGMSGRNIYNTVRYRDIENGIKK